MQKQNSESCRDFSPLPVQTEVDSGDPLAAGTLEQAPRCCYRMILGSVNEFSLV